MGTEGDTQRDLGRIEGRVTGIVASLDHLNKRFDSFEATNSRRFEELTELLQKKLRPTKRLKKPLIPARTGGPARCATGYRPWSAGRELSWRRFFCI